MMNFKSIQKALFFISFYFFLSNAYAAKNIQKVEIRILPESIVYGEQYTLGEVAELDGFDVKLIKRLSETTIGSSPLPGRSHYINKNRILNKLKSSYRDSKLEIIVSKKVMISRASSLIKKGQLKGMIESEVGKNYKKYDDVKISIKSTLRDIYLPKGEITYKIEKIGSNVLAGGLSSWKVTLFNNEKASKKLWVRVKVDIYDEVTMLNKKVKRGAIIRESDLIKKKKNISNIAYYQPLKKQSLVGKSARRALRPNEILKTSLVENPVIIDQGKHIVLQYNNRSVNLKTTVLALKSGRVGEMIPVKNMRSRKIIRAIILDEKTVEVIL